MAKIAPYVFFQEFDNSGNVLAGGKVYTYEAGTTTPKATYTTPDESTANANPVILDSNGRADIWLASGAYKFSLYTSADVLIKTIDNVVGEASAAFGASTNTITTNTIVTTAYDGAMLDCTSSVTLSLLDVATAQEGFLFTVKNSSSGNVTIDPDTSETINGATTLILGPRNTVLVVCNGTSWNSYFGDILHKYNATTSPTVNDDSADGYSIGSTWFDTTNDEFYRCLDTTIGAAVWVKSSLTIDELGTAATKNLIDDDTFATATSTNIPSAESVKAYVDATPRLSSPTSTATTSGTSIDVTGISASAKRIIISFVGVSTNGTSNLLLQIGDSGGIETTGYLSTASNGGSSTGSTSGFLLTFDTASTRTYSGTITLDLADSSTFTWSCSGSIGSDGARVETNGGNKSLSATLDRFRLTTVGGTATFSAGKIGYKVE